MKKLKIILFSVILSVGLVSGASFFMYDANFPNQKAYATDLVEYKNLRGDTVFVTVSSAEKLLERGYLVDRDSETGKTDYDLKEKSAETPTKMITTGNTGISSNFTYELGLDLWPQYSLTFPEEVKMGEPFDIVLDYAFVIPEVDDDENGVEFLSYENPEKMCSDECLEWLKSTNQQFFTSRNSYVDMQYDKDYVLSNVGNDTRYIPIMEYEQGDLLPIYNNTYPQQKILTFVINEPDTEYPLGHIRIDFAGDGKGMIYFHVKPGNVISLSDEPIILVGEGVPQLGLNIPDAPPRETPSDPLEGIDDIDELIHEMAEFWREYNPDSDIEVELRISNFTNAFIDRFFTLYPDLQKQSFIPISQFIMPSAYAQAPLTSFVYGKAYYYDLDNNHVPLKNTEICAYAKNYLTHDAVHNGQTHVCDDTNSSGNFYLVGVPQGINLVLAAHAEGDKIKVAKNNNLDLHVYYDIGSTLIDKGIFHVGTFNLPSSGTDSLAFKLLGELETINKWYNDKFNYNPSYVTAIWDPQQCNSVGVDGTFITFSHTKYVPDDVKQVCNKHKISPITNSDTMAHEFAHVVFYDNYKSQNSDKPDYFINNAGGWHSPVHIGNSPGLAWVEGWAFFIATAYSGVPIYQPSYMTGQWDFETRTHNEASDTRFKGKPFVSGITGEGNVAAVLYDVFDTTNELGDDQEDQLTNIWNTMRDNKESDENVIASDFNEFKNDWNDSSLPSLDSIFALNTISSSINVSGTILHDTFDNFDAWIEQGESDWRVGIPDEVQPPNYPPTNMVAEADNCDSECILLLKNSIDLTEYSSVTLSLFRYVDNQLDSGEYLKIDVSSNGGSTWSNIYTWLGGSDDDDIWHKETKDLSSYLNSTDFKIRIVVQMSSSAEDVAIDDVIIMGTPKSINNKTITSISDDFEGTLSKYILSGDEDWEIDSAHVSILQGSSANNVLTSSNCDDKCIITLNSKLDTSTPLSINFMRFIDTSIDSDEGLYVQYSIDDITWTTLAKYTANTNDDTNTWTDTVLILDITDSQASLRFLADSSSSSEFVEIDNLSIAEIKSS